MRYFLELAYNGAPFHGWQSQPNAQSVQSTIENALSLILRDKVAIVGAGRTDAGVHARKMYAHFDSTSPVVQSDKFLTSLNSLVGPFIKIKGIAKVSDEAHARFDAVKRSYKYFISYSKDPFLNSLFCRLHKPLDLNIMNQAADFLLETEDFTSFAKLHSDAKTNICKVTDAKWQKIENDEEAKNFLGTLNGGIVFTITADRFLRNMVRAIVGTLIEVGTYKLSIEGFRKIIESKNRCEAGSSIDANGLFLWDVAYPFDMEYIENHPKNEMP